MMSYLVIQTIIQKRIQRLCQGLVDVSTLFKILKELSLMATLVKHFLTVKEQEHLVPTGKMTVLSVLPTGTASTTPSSLMELVLLKLGRLLKVNVLPETGPWMPPTRNVARKMRSAAKILIMK